MSIGFPLALLLVILVVIGTSIFFYFIPVGPWITAYFSGVRVKIFRDLLGMRLRKVNPHVIIRPLISAHKAGLSNISISMLEAHYLAGGNVLNVVNALISADKASNQCFTFIGWYLPDPVTECITPG